MTVSEDEARHNSACCDGHWRNDLSFSSCLTEQILRGDFTGSKAMQGVILPISQDRKFEVRTRLSSNCSTRKRRAWHAEERSGKWTQLTACLHLPCKHYSHQNSNLPITQQFQISPFSMSNRCRPGVPSWPNLQNPVRDQTEKALQTLSTLVTSLMSPTEFHPKKEDKISIATISQQQKCEGFHSTCHFLTTPRCPRYLEGGMCTALKARCTPVTFAVFHE